MSNSSLRTSLSKLKNVLTLKDPATRNLAMDLGLLNGQRNYVKFIILGRSRTGSNFLRGILNSHPNAVILGEIFRNEDAIDWDHPDFPGSQRILKLYQRDPLEFLQNHVYRKANPNVLALGFKLFYYHARKQPWDQLWPYLQAQSDIRIIHIKRRNILRTHLSREKAEKSGLWVNTTGEREEQKALVLDYAECLEDFTRTRRWEQENEAFFKDHPLINVYYEDLSSDYSGQAARVINFLGLPPMPVKPKTHKQSVLPLNQAIANYVEIKQKFEGSEWAPFFDE